MRDTCMKNSITKLWFLLLFDKAGNIDYTLMVPDVTVLVQSSKKKGRDRGRWVGAPEGCKQHGHVWARL